MEKNKRDVFVILGPTGSGKSACALELAKKIDGEIVNGDSRQIYKILSYGTCKPNQEQQESVAHHLYDFLEPTQPYNAGRYAKDAEKIILEILKREKNPIVVGGTGLYISALFDGLAELPEKDEAVRAYWLKIANEQGKETLHNCLKKKDPEAAEKIPYQNIQRTLRALEVFSLTGKKISFLQKAAPKKNPIFNPLFYGLWWEKSVLKERLLKRTKEILPGLILETEWLSQHGFKGHEPALQSLGYQQAIRYLNKEIVKEDLLNSLVLDTLHYAKRQMTYFKRDHRIHWIKMEEPFNPKSAAEKMVV
ncbi:MAG: tRNA (adenosine(37)-N6)-dimethylallyltransferase MiaA [Elusimicrobia bacterium]|nr:tRNA (adenosine(37)-N6)-dimethylallyltransferase MiaA [Elusimicrobiota bacterium]